MAVLTYWSQNALRLGIESVWTTLLGVVALVLAALLALRALSGSWARAGIGTALMSGYIFYAPVLLGFLGLPRLGTSVMLIAVAVLLVLYYRKQPGDPEKLATVSRMLNAVTLLLLCVTAVPLTYDQVRLERARSHASAAIPSLRGSAGSDSPDVWHILFDRYAADSTLRTVYDYDNSDFLNALRKRGFSIEDAAFSNYQRTGPSVASTLNGTLLDPMSAPMANQQEDWVPIYRIMRDSAALRQFNRMGYETIFAGSWWEPTRFSNQASRTISVRAIPQFARLLIDHSVLGHFSSYVSLPWLDGRGDQCFRVHEKVRQLQALTASESRKMVFAHFLVPHPPFTLNADGTCRELATARGASRRDNYIGQVKAVNAKALQLIDAIIASPRPSVIVLHSDEGPWPEPYVGNEHQLGTDPVPVPWPALTPAQLHEKYAILLAVRTPDGTPPVTMPNSPVQIYPAILNDYFDARASLPASRHLMYKSESALYEFLDIGDRLGDPKSAATVPKSSAFSEPGRP